MEPVKILAAYLLIVNVIAYILYGVDKLRAKRGAWRISEAALLVIALVGGSVGALLGMHSFHHKTKHWSFRIGVPLIFILHLLLAWILIRK